jgi:MoaA/NifB/PqqE/SkfB family radical SAM enzyme
MVVWEQVHQRALRQRIPLRVHFDLTYRCHQRCLHCYLPEAYRRGEGPGPELDTDQIKGILDQLAAAGTFFLSFSGGEIFLRPDLMDILEYARQSNFSLSLYTSGTWGLDARLIGALAELGIEGLLVSLYSLKPAIHDRVTGVPGSWAQLWPTVKECQALGLKLVWNTMAFSFNYTEIPALKEFAAQENIPLRVDTEITPRWDGRPHPKRLGISPEAKLELNQALGLKTLEPRVTEPITFPFSSDFEGCGAGLNSCYLSPQGEVWPCVDAPWPCGQLLQRDEFFKVWQESRKLNWVRELRQRLDHQDKRLCHYFWEKENRRCDQSKEWTAYL